MLSGRMIGAVSMRRILSSSARAQGASYPGRSLWSTRSIATRSFSAQPMLDSESKINTMNMIEREWSPPKDPWDLHDVLESSTASYEQLPEWDAQYVSRTSLERLKIYKNEERTTHQGIPTLVELAALPLPPPEPTLTETDHKIYALQRKRRQFQYIAQQVAQLAESRVEKIRAIEDWQEKQDAVDILFEDIEAQLVAQEEILGKHPSFGKWVERALEEYLQSIQKECTAKLSSTDDIPLNDADALPLFMDCMDSATDDAESVAPKILHPLRPRDNPHAETAGMMLEEWELAAHKSTKRILLRQSTRQIAKALLDESTKRVYVHGPQGVGKTAVLASIVASARASGSIVLYMPDGDDLHQNGFYMEPNEKQPGLFDLPVLAKNACSNLLTSHEEALKSFVVSKDIIEKLCSVEQLKQLDIAGDVSATDLLKQGVAMASTASVAFAAVVEVLMAQDQVDFVMALDEFNCYFEKGHYYHGDYEDAKRPVPYDQISLFRPALQAMSISNKEETDLQASQEPAKLMKRGAIIVATTESHAIARKITDALTANAKDQQSVVDEADASCDLQVIQVRRFSTLEVDHILANFEATGVGKLRLDRGETVRNEQEVARLRMISGGVGQRLLDACIM